VTIFNVWVRLGLETQSLGGIGLENLGFHCSVFVNGRRANCDRP